MIHHHHHNSNNNTNSHQSMRLAACSAAKKEEEEEEGGPAKMRQDICSGFALSSVCADKRRRQAARVTARGRKRPTGLWKEKKGQYYCYYTATTE